MKTKTTGVGQYRGNGATREVRGKGGIWVQLNGLRNPTWTPAKKEATHGR